MGPPFNRSHTRNRTCECIQINVESTRFSNKFNLLQTWACSQPKKTRKKTKSNDGHGKETKCSNSNRVEYKSNQHLAHVQFANFLRVCSCRRAHGLQFCIKMLHQFSMYTIIPCALNSKSSCTYKASKPTLKLLNHPFI